MSTNMRRFSAALAGSGLAASMLLAGTPAASAAPTQQYDLVLMSLDCRVTEDWWWADTAVIRVNGENEWGPKDMKKGESIGVHRTIRFTNTAVVRLYDLDEGFDEDDFLGQVRAKKSQAGAGEQRASFRENGAHYVLTYKVVPARR